MAATAEVVSVVVFLVAFSVKLTLGLPVAATAEVVSVVVAKLLP